MSRQNSIPSDREGRGADRKKKGRGRLRIGFSTGTAVSASARAALRFLLTGEQPAVVAVRLPGGVYLPVSVAETWVIGEDAWATVIKDAGDDPDVTHGAHIQVRLRLFGSSVPCGRPRGWEATPVTGANIHEEVSYGLPQEAPEQVLTGVCLIAGEGVGVVTKPGLPVAVGEPAVNPIPREMLLINLNEEFQRPVAGGAVPISESPLSWKSPVRPFVWLGAQGGTPPATGAFLEVEITVPRGMELAQHTLNPRLGIVGGISILGTTGLVKPFSHEAYEETIQTALTVARSNGCDQVVLSTGGKSEKLARKALRDWPAEAFVQVADFFAYSVRTASEMGFTGIVHSVFFGKAIKMARGHAYTHAHKVSLDLQPLAASAREAGYDAGLCRELADANTAQHALEILLANQACDLIEAVARQALAQSVRIAENVPDVRLLLFDQKGSLLADVSSRGREPG
ncbi:MAG: cobalt-precorrin-5B (C(1))-methyltransferase CbiD [Syntrophobacteraceae bacterium]